MHQNQENEDDFTIVQTKVPRTLSPCVKDVDVHVCGKCRAEFSNIDSFVKHKKNSCVVQTMVESTDFAEPMEISLERIKVENEDERVKMENEDEDILSEFLSCYIEVVSPDSITENDAELRTPSSVTEEQLSCACCSFSTGDSEILFEHMKIHADKILFETYCEACGKRFVSEDELQTHSCIGEGENQHYCCLCDFIAEDSDALAEHMKNHVYDTIYECEICSYAAKDSIELIQHLRIHSDLKESTKLEHRKSIKHKRIRDGKDLSICEKCGKGFKRRDKLQSHMRIHTEYKPHKCSFCPYAARDRGSVRKHMRIHTNERPYKCDICPYAARDGSQLVVHMRIHTGDNPFPCMYGGCTSAFKTSTDLRRHLRVHTGEKPYACDMCDYKCAIKTNLNIHVKLNHTNVKLFSCKQCGFSASLRKVKEHEKIHAEKLHKCMFCGYTCVNIGSLKSHLKVHSSEKPYQCPECAYACKQHANLKTHFRKKHQDKCWTEAKYKMKALKLNLKENSPIVTKRHKCSVCEAEFVREDSLRSHKRRHKDKEVTTNNPPFSSLLAQCVVVSESQSSTQDCISSGNSDFSSYFEKSNVDENDPLKSEMEALERTIISVSENSVHFENRDDTPKANPEQNQKPVVVYLEGTVTSASDGVDDNLRSAEILASLNEVTTSGIPTTHLEVGQTLLVTRPENLASHFR